jgi:aryl-alcohol dehydrogenase-like predicted oxidoreductase
MGARESARELGHGASRLEQIGDNMRAVEVATKLTPELKQRIDDVVGDAYE